jgi:hypothetical protein
VLLSIVQIANLALQHLGEDDRISDLNEVSRPARIVKAAWDTTRLLVLADAHWSFAARTLELTARPAHPDFPIALGRTAFPLPADLVNLVEIVEPELMDDSDEFAIEAGPNSAELLVDHPGPITIRYIRDTAEIADPARWSPGFAGAFAFRLAWQISDSLAAKTSRKDRAWNNYLAELKKAKKANARTKPFRRNPRSDWSRARHSGGSSPYRPVPTQEA